MVSGRHRNLTGAAAVHPAAFIQDTDPGAVGAMKFWVDTTTQELFYRNEANDGWTAAGLTVETVWNKVGTGTSFPARGAKFISTGAGTSAWDTLGRYDLREWGTLPTGTNDCSAYIQTALNDISTMRYEADGVDGNDEYVQGGVLELPTKHMWIDSQITVPTHVKIDGPGPQNPRGAGDKGGYSGARLKATASLTSSMFLIQHASIGNGFRNFSMDGNKDDHISSVAMHGFEEEWIPFKVTGVTGVADNSNPATANVITVTGHGLRDGDRISFSPLAGGAGLTATTRYYARDTTTNTLRVALSKGGAAIDFTSDITNTTVATLWAANVHASYTQYENLIIENFPGIGIVTSPIHINPFLTHVISAKNGRGGALLACTDAHALQCVFSNNGPTYDATKRSFGLWTPLASFYGISNIMYKNDVNRRIDANSDLAALNYVNTAYSITDVGGLNNQANLEGLILPANTKRTKWVGVTFDSNSLKSWGGSTSLTGIVGDHTNLTFTKSGHGLVNGDPITFSSHGGAPTIVDGTLYYVINVVGTTFQISDTSGGDPFGFDVDMTDGIATAKGVSAAFATDVFTAKGHRLVIGDRLFFTAKSGGTGVTLNQVYYATETSAGSYTAGTSISTADTFKLAATLADSLTGTSIDVTGSDLTAGVMAISRSHVAVESTDMNSHIFSACTFSDTTTGGRPYYDIEWRSGGTSVIQIDSLYHTDEHKSGSGAAYRFSDSDKVMTKIDNVRHFAATLFPTGGLIAGDKCLRTDVSIAGTEFTYDGSSKWLGPAMQAATTILTSNATFSSHTPLFANEAYDHWVESFFLGYIINTTSTSSGNTWATAILKEGTTAANTIITPLVIQDGAGGTTWPGVAGTIYNNQLTWTPAAFGAGYGAIRLTGTKTGSPGTLGIWLDVVYRIIG